MIFTGVANNLYITFIYMIKYYYMPSLNEYINTLRKYNPGITDRSISIYLLKDGWKIEEIENAFRELNTELITKIPVPVFADSQITQIPQTSQVPQASQTQASQTMTNMQTEQMVQTPQVSQMFVPVISTASVSLAETVPMKTLDQISSASPVYDPITNSITNPVNLSHTNLQEKMEELIHEREIFHKEEVISHSSPGIPIVNSLNPQVVVMPVLTTSIAGESNLIPQSVSIIQSEQVHQSTPVLPAISTQIPLNVAPAQNSALNTDTQSTSASVPISISVAAPMSAPVLATTSVPVSKTSIPIPISIPIPVSVSQVPVSVINVSSIPVLQNSVSFARAVPISTDSKSVPIISSSMTNQLPVTPASSIRSSFGEPIVTLRPKFSYDEVMDSGSGYLTHDQIQQKTNNQSAQNLQSIKSSQDPQYSQNKVSNQQLDAKNIDTINIKGLNIEPNLEKSMVMPNEETAKAMMNQYGISQNKNIQSTKIEKGLKILKTLIYIFIISALLFGLGFAYIKYVHGVYFFVHEPINTERPLTSFASVFASMKTANYDTKINMRFGEKDEAVELFNFSKAMLFSEGGEVSNILTEGIDMFIESLPENISLNTAANGVYNQTKISNDGKLVMSGALIFDKNSIEYDIETLKIKDEVFVKVKKINFPFFNIDSIKDVWIRLTKKEVADDLNDLISLEGFNLLSNMKSVLGNQTSEKENKEDQSIQKQLATILEVADDTKVFEIVDVPKKIELDDSRTVYEYEVRLNLVNAITFAETISPKLKAEFGDIALMQFTPADIEKLKKPSFVYVYQYFINHSKFIIAIDSKGHPAYIKNDLRFAMKGEKVVKQMNINIENYFSNINQEVKIETPLDAISYNEAIAIISNKSIEEILSNNQYIKINEIRKAIEEYEFFNGEVPISLDDLRNTTANLAIPSLALLYETSTDPIYAKSINDIFTELPFVYQKDDKFDYSLTYNMFLPKHSQNKIIPNAYYIIDKSDLKKEIIHLTYANGVNTATRNILSKESEILKLKDTDRDKISDSLEIYMGTNPNKSDSDTNGKSDYTEFIDQISEYGDMR